MQTLQTELACVATKQNVQAIFFVSLMLTSEFYFIHLDGDIMEVLSHTHTHVINP